MSAPRKPTSRHRSFEAAPSNAYGFLVYSGGCEIRPDDGKN
jgi:hypothetical protein